MKNPKILNALIGGLTGLANGIFGSGGGIIAVPMLQKSGLSAKQAHASSLALTLPLSVVSAVIYGMHGSLPITDTLPLIPFGLAGAIIGALTMKKIPTEVLKRIFGIILIASGVRLLI